MITLVELTKRFFAAETGGAANAAQSGVLKFLSYAFPIAYLPLTYSFGQGLHLFWFSSATVAIAVNYALRKTAIGVALGIPAKKKPTDVTPVATFSSRQDAVRRGTNAAQLAKLSRAKHGVSSTQEKQ